MILKNVSKMPFSFSLLKGVDYGAGFAPEVQEDSEIVTLDDGTIGKRYFQREHPQSLTVAPGESLQVPDAVKQIAEVNWAIVHGMLLAVADQKPSVIPSESLPEDKVSAKKKGALEDAAATKFKSCGSGKRS